MGVQEDLDQLERQIRQLQIEWEKFFGGVERKPPNELKSQVEALIRRYAYAELRNNAERFRYQTLSARYSTFSELWSKRLRALEEGRPVGIHGPRVAAVHAPSSPERGPAGGSRPTGEIRVRDPQHDTESVRALFDRFVQARREAGESAAVKFESFQKLIAQQAQRILQEKGARAVDFRLETKDGKVSLKARPVRS